MKKRFLILLIISVSFIIVYKESGLSFGYNFSFPFARRSGISGLDYSQHQAYDYGCYNGEKVAASLSGVVINSSWAFPDDTIICDDPPTIRNRGNYVILDHGSNLESWYFHLSNTGNRPGVGASFPRGGYLAKSDNTGCSTGSHLHFATKLNDIPFDPYADMTDWVSGVPVPMGYRDQTGTVIGPFSISASKIENKWLALEGKPGAPLDFHSPFYCNGGMYGRRQMFEQGEIEYCGSGSATFNSYVRYYLPDIDARYTIGTGWNSRIYVYNYQNGSATISVTLYAGDGKVYDTRVYRNIPGRAQWFLNVWDIVFNPLMYAGTGTYYLTAEVASNLNISVVALRQKSNSLDAANSFLASPLGDPLFEQSAGLLYASSVYNNIYNLNSTVTIWSPTVADASVEIDFISRDGYVTSTGAAFSGRYDLPLSDIFGSTSWSGSLIVTSENPLAVQVADVQTTDQSTRAYNASADGAYTLYIPAAYKNMWDLNSGFVVQNLDDADNAAIYLYFYGRDGTQPPGVNPYNFGTVPPHRAVGLWLGNVPGLGTSWTGSIRIESTTKISAVVQNAYTGKGIYSYNAPGLAGTTVYLPRAARNAGGRTTGYTFQNICSWPITVNATYYNTNGSQIGNPVSFNLAAYGSAGRAQKDDGHLSDGWEGAIKLSTNSTCLVGIMREDLSNSTSAYNGLSR